MLRLAGITLVCTLLFGGLAFAETTKTPAKSKTTAKAQDPECKLTPEEEKFVRDARKIFQQAKKLPPPSKHMQEKMQSGM